MIIFQLFCYLFTLYFLVAVGYETFRDLESSQYSSKLVYAKKFAVRFWSNFLYRLPDLNTPIKIGGIFL